MSLITITSNELKVFIYAHEDKGLKLVLIKWHVIDVHDVDHLFIGKKSGAKINVTSFL